MPQPVATPSAAAQAMLHVKHATGPCAGTVAPVINFEHTRKHNLGMVNTA
jgi:hypothetical protein